jgi:quinol monooxygenase YgiN
MTPTHFIIHTIDLKPGTLDDVRTFFENVVPKLAESFDAWCGARLTADRETNQIVTVGAWADSGQMQAFLQQPSFSEAMAGFAEYFAAPPKTTITEVITQVGPNSY